VSNVFAKTPRNKVKRLAERGSYDPAIIYPIVDAALICHVGFVLGGQPYMIPTLHARQGDTILLHGAKGSRMLRHVAAGGEVCIAMTLTDGIVLARSVFHHSINYRSAVLFGRGAPITDDDARMAALEAFTERLLPGRWADARPPNLVELKQTTIVAVPIESASAKTRGGPPGDEPADLDLPVWAGVLPLRQLAEAPQADPTLRPGIDIPDYLVRYVRAINELPVAPPPQPPGAGDYRGPIDVLPVVLEGRHVRLEPLTQAHAPELAAVSGDEQIWQYYPKSLATLEDVRAWIDIALEQQAAGTALPFAIIHKELGRAIGSTRYLNIMPADRGLEIGSTWLGREYWRTAINSECKLLLLRHAFETLGCIRVQLKTDRRNERSRRAIERLGAQFEGILRRHMIVRDGAYRDSAMYSIVESEWPATKTKLLGNLDR
jgi:RimJ/RimL family protein N-acetyltransferase/nitroimidazol reductase NimA-like FMN-containing flavoprotein (pyridoxamine 5'-phosphate oxidase superfamily)